MAEMLFTKQWVVYVLNDREVDKTSKGKWYRRKRGEEQEVTQKEIYWKPRPKARSGRQQRQVYKERASERGEKRGRKGKQKRNEAAKEGEERLPGSDPQHGPLSAWPAAASETLAGTLECPCAVQGPGPCVTAVQLQHSHQRYGLRPDCSADLPSLLGQELAETLQEICLIVAMAKLVKYWPGDSWLW